MAPPKRQLPKDEGPGLVPQGLQRTQTRTVGALSKEKSTSRPPASQPWKGSAMHPPKRQRWKLMWSHLARKA